MRPVTVLGSTLAVMMLGNACATNSSGSMSSRYGSAQGAPKPTIASYGPLGDSIIAQAIADREGPRVSIHAQLTSFSDSRRVRGVFRLDDDAYVVVGHIDADGVLRIAFPGDPSDDGFVRGDRTYQTGEFFAGFNSEYRFRARTSMLHYSAASRDTYDGGLGYVFVIASWRPMHFERFQTGNVWDSFELADENYMRDPRPAIHELATLLAGDNSEAYTVKFARYTDTQTLYGGYGSFASSAGYNAGYCAGYEPVGFASSPFGFGASRAFDSYGYGTNFRYRGTNYYYDSVGDCYKSSGYNPFAGYRIVQGPGVPTPTTPRALATDGNRPRPVPQALPGHFMPKDAGAAAPADEATLHSPEYRQRGLITDDVSSTGPIRRQPRVEGSTPGEERVRPSIQDMVNRRGENTHEGSLPGRARMGQDANIDNAPRQGGSQPIPRSRAGSNDNGEPRSYSRPEARDPAVSQPARTEPSPRMQAPERASPPTRTEPAPRMQAPERTSPPPARPEPRSEPASRPATPPPAASSAAKPDTPVKPPTM